MEEKIEHYIRESKKAYMTNYPKQQFALISSYKIATVTGFHIDVVEEFLKTSKLVTFSFINQKYNIYKIL